MTTRVFLKPKEGLRLRLADGTPWPAAGELVDGDDLYVRRRIADGDVVAAEEAASPEAAGTKTRGSARA